LHRLRTSIIPIYPKDFVTANIVPAYGTIILTSATLSVNKDFSLITDTLGLAGAKTRTLPSPFDIQKQVHIEIKRGINLLTNGEGIKKLAKVILDEGRVIICDERIQTQRYGQRFLESIF